MLSGTALCWQHPELNNAAGATGCGAVAAVYGETITAAATAAASLLAAEVAAVGMLLVHAEFMMPGDGMLVIGDVAVDYAVVTLAARDARHLCLAHVRARTSTG